MQQVGVCIQQSVYFSFVIAAYGGSEGFVFRRVLQRAAEGMEHKGGHMVQCNLESAIEHTLIFWCASRFEDGCGFTNDIEHLAAGCFPVAFVILVADQQHIVGGQVLVAAGQLLVQHVFLRAAALPQHESYDGLPPLGCFCFCGCQGGMNSQAWFFSAGILLDVLAGLVIQLIEVPRYRLTVSGGEFGSEPIAHIYTVTYVQSLGGRVLHQSFESRLKWLSHQSLFLSE